MRTIPALVLVLSPAFDVTVPPVSVMFTDAAVTPLAEKFVQLLTVNTPTRVIPPITLEAAMLPVPAVRVMFCKPEPETFSSMER